MFSLRLYNNVAQCNDSGEKLENNQNYSTDPLRTVDLFRWAYQIASGMNFLATKKVTSVWMSLIVNIEQQTYTFNFKFIYYVFR